MDEHQFILGLKNPQGENLKYFAVDLIAESYDPEKLARIALKEEAQQQLYFIATMTKEATQAKGMRIDNLEHLARRLGRPAANSNWVHLDPSLPDWAKRITEKNPPGRIQEEAKVYSLLSVGDISDWIDLYITHKYASAPRR